jgi:hypothetical protein
MRSTEKSLRDRRQQIAQAVVPLAAEKFLPDAIEDNRRPH